MTRLLRMMLLDADGHRVIWVIWLGDRVKTLQCTTDSCGKSFQIEINHFVTKKTDRFCVLLALLLAAVNDRALICSQLCS